MNIFIAFVVGCSLFVDNACESKSVKLSEKEVECLSQAKIYHVASDKCYKLLTRGPCEHGHWYVLEKPGSGGLPDSEIPAVCAEERCPEGGYYWPKTKTCVQQKDKNHLCGSSSDQELLNNVFGEAECRCARDPVRVRLNGDQSERCYQLYTQEACRPGEVVGFANENLKKATCIEDKCYEESARRRKEGSLGRDGVLAPWKNGSCYELGTQGPCPETMTFKVHEAALAPHCITLTNTIFDLEKPQKCYQDENDECQKTINSSKLQNAENYKKDLFNSLTAARKRRNLS